MRSKLGSLLVGLNPLKGFRLKKRFALVIMAVCVTTSLAATLAFAAGAVKPPVNLAAGDKITITCANGKVLVTGANTGQAILECKGNPTTTPQPTATPTATTTPAPAGNAGVSGAAPSARQPPPET